MADAYKGLIVQIGADDTKLQKVLDTIEKAARNTESELRTLSKALKADPESFSIIKNNVALLGERAKEAAGKVSMIQDALDGVSPDVIRELSAHYDDISIRMKEAVQRQTDVNGQIHALNEEMDALRASIVACEKVAEKAGAVGTKEFREAEEAANEYRERLEALEVQYRSVAATGAKYDQEVALLRQAEAARSAGIQQEYLNSTIGETLQRQASLSVMAVLTEELGDGFAESEKRAKGLSDAMDECRRRVEQAKAATEALPDDLRAAGEYAAALADYERLANLRARELESQISTLESKGFDEAAASVNGLAHDIMEATRRLTGLLDEETRAAGEAERLRQSADRMSDQFERSFRTLEHLPAKIAEARSEAMRWEQEQERVTGEVKKVRNELAGLQGAARLQGLRSDLVAVGAAVAQVRPKVEALKSSMLGLGISLSSTVTPLVMIGMSKVIDYADSVDSAYRDMRKTVNASESQFERMRTAAFEYSMANPVSAETLLRIEALGGQMGIAADDLEEFAKVVANLDIATDIDAETVSKQLGQLANIMGMTTDEFGSFGDALVRLGNNMPTMESDIMEITARIGSMGSLLGMSYDQLLGWAAALSSTGQKSEAAGTALSKSFSDINTAVSKGGDRLALFAEVANMTATEFATLWREDASSAFMAFVGGLREYGSDADGILQQLKITGVRQKQALLGLANSYDNVSIALEMSADAAAGTSDQWGSAGDAAREAANKAQGFSGALTVLRNAAEVLGAEVGDTLVPVVKGLSVIVGKLADAWLKVPGSMQGVILATTGLTAATGPLLTGLSSAQSAVKSWSDNIGKGAKSMFSYADSVRIASTATGVLSKMSAGLIAVDVIGVIVSIGSVLHGMAEAAQEARIRTDETTGAIIADMDMVSMAASSAQSVIDQFRQAESTGSLSSSGALSMYRGMIEQERALREALEASRGDLDKAADNVEEARARYVEAMSSDGADIGHWGEVDYSALQGIDDAQEAYDTVVKTVEEAQKTYDDLGFSIESVMRWMDVDAKRTSAVAKVHAELGDVTEITQEQYDALGLSTDKYGYSLDQLNRRLTDDAAVAAQVENYALANLENEVSTLTISNNRFSESLRNLGISSSLFTEQLVAAGWDMDAYGAKLDELTKQVMNFWQAVNWTPENDYVTAWNNLQQSQNALEVWNSDLQWMFETFGNNEATMRVFNGGIEENGQLINQLHAQWLEFGGDLDTVLPGLEEQGVTLRSFFEGVQEAEQVASDVATSIPGIISGIGPASEGIGEAMVDGTEQGMENEEETFYNNCVQYIRDAIEQGQTEAEATAPIVGMMMDTGMASGVYASEGECYEAVRRVVDGMIAAARDEASIASPSKVFAGLGRYMSQGLAVGIDDSAMEAISAARRLVDGASRSASMAVRNSRYAVSMVDGVTKQDLMDAVGSISNSQQRELAVYIDGRQLTSAIAGRMDVRLGTIAARRER